MADTQSKTQPASKKNDQVTKHLADMLGLESHIFQALDKQVKGTEDEPDINPKIRQMRETMSQHVDSLKRRIEQLGGQVSRPVKEAGAAVLGVAAGLIDKVRAEEVAKDFRDSYTAISLSNISYVMLITTALACDDPQTAELGSRNLKENAEITMQIGHLMPGLVVRDLRDAVPGLNPNAIQQAEQAYREAWR